MKLKPAYFFIVLFVAVAPVANVHAKPNGRGQVESYRVGRSVATVVENDDYVVFMRTNHAASAPAEISGARKVFDDTRRGLVMYRLPRGSGKAQWEKRRKIPAQFREWPCYRSRSADWVVPTGSILVQFRPEVPQSRVSAFLKNAGATVERKRRRENSFEVAVPVAETVFKTAMEWEKSPLVEWAQADCARETRSKHLPDDTLFPDQWNLHNTSQNGSLTNRDVDAPSAWDITRGSTGVVIAIMDDGIDVAHPDLAANIFINDGEYGEGKESNGLDDDGNGYIDDWRGWNFVQGNNDPLPRVTGEDHHGTMSAGVACAVSDNALGIAGLASGCRVMSVRVVSSGDDVTDSAWADAFEYCADMADVISMGYYLEPVPVIVDALNYVLVHGREGKGTVIFTAMGNDGVFRRYSTDVGTMPHVICVSGTSNHDRRSYFSDYGFSVDMVAPAGGDLGIYTTDRSGSAEGDYIQITGTSWASPLAAAAAALVIEQHPDWNGLKVRQVMETSCDRIDAEAHPYDAQGRNSEYGHGRLNAYGALTDAEPAWDPYEPDSDTNSAATITDGEMQYRSIDSTSDVDVVTLDLSARSDIWIMAMGSTNLETALYSNNVLIAGDLPGFYSQVEVTNLPPGRYNARVWSPSGAVVSNYGLSFSVVNCRDAYESDDSTNTAKTILPREMQYRTFYPDADRDFAVFTLQTNRNVVIRTFGDWFGDTVLWLYDSAGNVITNNDDVFGTGLSQVSPSLTAGTYYVEVRDYYESNCPSYQLICEVYEPDSDEPDPDYTNAVEIGSGDRITRTLWPTNDVDWFVFTLTNDANVFLCTDSSHRHEDADTTLTVYLHDGGTNSEIGYDDNGNGRGDSFSALYLPELTAGLYYAKVQGKGILPVSPNYFLSLDVYYKKVELGIGGTNSSRPMFEWQGDASYNYRMEKTCELVQTQSWAIVTNIEGRAGANRWSGESLSVPGLNASTQGFYRLIMQ